jgi:hypothetical protein
MPQLIFFYDCVWQNSVCVHFEETQPLSPYTSEEEENIFFSLGIFRKVQRFYSGNIVQNHNRISQGALNLPVRQSEIQNRIGRN